MKVAGAPISWGVSELADWGYRMDPERVLAEMRGIGLEATELGPPGYLPRDAASRRAVLARHGMRLVAGFVAVVLHEKGARALREIAEQAASLAESGAETVVLAAALPGGGYDVDRCLAEREWAEMAAVLDLAEDAVAARGLKLAFHPHAGTAVAARDDVDRLLRTTDVDICLDTGHLYLGGSDPVEVAREAGTRVTHVHLKDVDGRVARRVRSGEVTYAQGVREGLYRPLGQGDLDVEAVVSRIQESGYRGWFVLEQDTALTAEPDRTHGPAEAARQSLDHFRRITSAKQTTNASKED